MSFTMDDQDLPPPPIEGNFDDMSTLGADWDNETKGGESVSKGEGGENDTFKPASVAGDIDEEDLEADRQKYLKDHELIVDGYRCPDDCLKLIAPMEFEEMVSLFVKFDSDKSGTIDKHETKKILNFLGMDASLEKAEELLDIVDADKSGAIDFDEFCRFIVMIKRGDERLNKFGSLLDKLNSTPLGELERQCKNRGLKITFVIVEERPATLTNPTCYVVELHLSGMWYTVVNGDPVGTQLTKRFQGMGNSTRDAKYAAAAAAIVNMGDSMPGVKFKEGEFSQEWYEWIDDNLLRGVDPGKIVNILASKGFHPHKNTKLMHRMLTWNSLEMFLSEHPDLDLSASDVDLDDDFFEWIQMTVNKGIDGGVVVDLLKDRCIDLTKEHLLFAQKLRNNELGVQMARDGQVADVLDFWHACKKGYYEDVLIYCKCSIKVNEEKLDRHTTERVRPLTYAAMGGHTQVVELLLEYKAEVNAFDRKGRTALHYAALCGSAPTCKVLIDHGAMIFAGDHQGNMALHLAAMNNHYDAVDLLANMGQELTRTIYSDKVKSRANGDTFDKLVREVFEQMPPLKLSPADTIRFEKTWLNEASKYYIKLMDENVRYMLPTSCDQIMHDVLSRFDPRPETGIFVTVDGAAEQKFIKVVPTPAELGILLKYTYRQAALDSINSWSRTALHVACDANKVNSHERVIGLLINTYGCNVSLRDRHNRRPIELLVKDKIYTNMPSATQIREELLIDRRTTLLDELFERFAQEERVKTNQRRQYILDECLDRDTNISQRMWDCTREASIFKKRYGKAWELYEDPDTGNYFYTKMPKNRLMGDTFGDYCWEIPNIAKALIHRTEAIAYQRLIRSTLLRKYKEWEMYRDIRTTIEFYWNPETEELRFVPPPEMNWKALMKEGTKTDQKLGYANEWEVWTDKCANTFYRHHHTKMCEWERPIDAVVPTPDEKICTAHQFKGRPVEQKWYSCEQCNRAWKSSAEGSTKTVKICEPCVFRCHVGHKGVRFIRESAAICICAMVLKVIGTEMCNACVISDKQLAIQGAAANLREDQALFRRRNITSPPMFALVPRFLPDGRLKMLSGWRICRRSLGFDETAPDAGDTSTVTAGSDSDSDDQSSVMGKLMSGAGSLAGEGSIASLASAEKGGGGMDHYLSLPLGWTEAYDVEEPETLKYNDKVLCTRLSGLPRVYGTVRVESKKKGYYKIKFVDSSIEDEIIERSHLELVSRSKFYCQLDKGLCAWTTEEAVKHPMESHSLTMCGEDWHELFRKSTLRRTFNQYDELHLQSLDHIFYMHYDDYKMELAILRVQDLVRAKFQFRRPVTPWTSRAFSFDTPDEVKRLKRIKNAWAYLRRRSNNVGEFMDKDGVEWEEYMDKKTSEYFYWTEEENLFQWDKPELFVRQAQVVASFALGEELMYRFPGRRIEEICVVTRVRFDDETGEDKYDIVHKYVPDMKYTWVTKMELKRAPKEGDALALANLETKWKNQIRRQREAEDRKKKKDREAKLQAELDRLEYMKSMAYKLGNKGEDDNTVSLTTRLMRGRMQRISLEAQEVREEQDAIVGKKRRDAVTEQMNKLRDSMGGRLTRADILSMTRSLDLKLQLEEKIELRNKVQEELFKRKREAQEHDRYIEDTVRETEIQTTTPRSLARRKIIRNVHIGMKRQDSKFLVCEWGCGDWFKIGHEQSDHQLRRCCKRVLACTLGCPMKDTEENWLRVMKTEEAKKTVDDLLAEDYLGHEKDHDTVVEEEKKALGAVTYQQYHETEECPKRLVICPKNCLEWICFEVLDKHLNELCTKRPAKPLECRLGCGQMFGGKVETLIQAEDDRLQHENEECDLRMVRCNWMFDDGKLCAAQMRACDRTEHRDYHLTLQGVLTYVVPGTYVYKVPKNVSRMKVQLWGAGGGSGYFKGRQGGAGGGGAFVEAILDIEPFSILELIVGSGGCGGVTGTELSAVDIHEQRRKMAIRRDVEIHLPKGVKMTHEDADAVTGGVTVIDASCGVALGGQPGGGEGYGGGGCWAAGGGGGYTIISKRTQKGNQALLVAAGGGGGGSLPGLPGCGLEGSLYGTLLDPINGVSATVSKGGGAGDSGNTYNSAWPASEGAAWMGGNGCEFGAGGGGGYFGGGGGGTAPGISGGGGGGSSYLFIPKVRDYVTILGHGIQPGGLEHDPPEACGLGEWDKTGGWAGQGGKGDPYVTSQGNNGAIRLIKPGHY